MDFLPNRIVATISDGWCSESVSDDNESLLDCMRALELRMN